MAVLFLAPRLAVHAIMRVQKHHQAGIGNGCPYRLKRVVVQPFPYAFRAHNDPF